MPPDQAFRLSVRALDIGNVEVRYDADKKRVIYEPVTSVEPRVLVPRGALALVSGRAIASGRIAERPSRIMATPIRLSMFKEVNSLHLAVWGDNRRTYRSLSDRGLEGGRWGQTYLRP